MAEREQNVVRVLLLDHLLDIFRELHLVLDAYFPLGLLPLVLLGLKVLVEVAE